MVFSAHDTFSWDIICAEIFSTNSTSPGYSPSKVVKGACKKSDWRPLTGNYTARFCKARAKSNYYYITKHSPLVSQLMVFRLSELFSSSQSAKFSVYWLFPYCCLSANELFVVVSKMKRWIIRIRKWNIQIKQWNIQIKKWNIQKN